MAKISSELMNTLTNLQKLLLESVNEAKASEFYLLERYGETDETIATLDELTAISQQAAELYTQISRLLLRTTEIQPAITSGMLDLLTKRVTTVENRVPALQQSIKEIKSDWGLL